MTGQDEEGRLDAPNQQVVRPDASHPAEEGTGGTERPPDQAPPAEELEPEPDAEPAPAKRPARKR